MDETKNTCNRCLSSVVENDFGSDSYWIYNHEVIMSRASQLVPGYGVVNHYSLYACERRKAPHRMRHYDGKPTVLIRGYLDAGGEAQV